MKFYYVAGHQCYDSLCHYGILGQKWGIRRFQNKDGSLTSEGRERYGRKEEQKRLSDKVVKAGGYSDNQTLKSINRNAISQTSQVKHAVNQIRELSRRRNEAEKTLNSVIDRDFYNDPEVYEKYLDKAVDKFMKQYGDMVRMSRESYPSIFPNSSPLSDREYTKWMYKHEDWDSGEFSSLAMFESSNDPRNSELRKAKSILQKVTNDEHNATKNLVHEFLGDFENERVHGDLNKRTAGQRLEQIINDDARFFERSFEDRIINPRIVL